MNTHGEPPASLQSDVADIERLILTLYQTVDPNERSRVDKHLIELQRSPQGFQIADQLLQSNSDEVRFYGARTFIVKIHKDLGALDEEPRQELLQRLVSWMVYATNNGYSSATLRKLCSAVAAYFIATEGTWNTCVHDVQTALLNGFEAESLNGAAKRTEAGSTLPLKQEKALLIFVSTLLQDASAIEYGPKSSKLHDPIDKSIKQIVQIIQRPFQHFLASSSLPTSNVEDAIDCFRSLVTWIKMSMRDDQVLDMVRPLNPVIISLITNETLSEIACQFTYEVMTDFATFFSQENYSQVGLILRSPEVGEWLRQLTAGEFDDEPLWMGKLLIGYGEAKIDDLAASEASEEYVTMLRHMLIPLSCKGVPAAEDSVAQPALEFWSSFVETVREWANERFRDPQYWLTWRGGLLKDLLIHIKLRVKHPTISDWKRLSPDEKKLFNYFRSDARDLVSSLEAFFGIHMTLDLVTGIIDGTEQNDWLGVEGAFFCLNSILSQVDYDERDMRRISDPLFQSIAGPSVIERVKTAVTDVPVVVYKEVVTFFSEIDTLAQHDSRLLLLILQCLADWFRLRPLAMSAATVFAHLCQHSREAVMQTGAANQLLDLLKTYAGATDRDFAVQEKLTGAVAAVAQAYATSSSSDAGLMLAALLEVVQQDVDKCLSVHEADPEQAQAIGLCALRCLANMGKAFRVPEHAIDLEEEEPAQPPSFWAQHPEETDAAQRKVLGQCTAVLGIFNGVEEVEAVCHILKSGYTESETGPFVFPLDATATLLKVCHLSTPSIGEVFKNVSVLLEKHKSRRSTEWVLRFAQDCLQHVRSMVQPYFDNDPSRDPEVAALVVDFLKSYTPAYNDVLIVESAERSDCLDFAMTCLASNEILPKQSAAMFWARFVKGPAGPMEDGYNALLNRYAQNLATVLIQQIGGGAARSDLEYFAEPVKAAVFKGGPFRKYMENALSALEVPDERVSATDKRVFLAKIFGLRGGARTGKITEEFWAQCRGTFLLS